MNDSIERLNCPFNRRGAVVPTDQGVSVLFAGVVQVHLRHPLASALMHDVRIDMQLSAVAFQERRFTEEVRFLRGLEVDDLYAAVISSDEVDLPFQDVVILDQGNINLCLLDYVPTPFLSSGVTLNLFECNASRCFCEVDAFHRCV